MDDTLESRVTEARVRSADELRAAINRKEVRIRIVDAALAKKILVVMNVDKAVILGSIAVIGYAALNLSTTYLIPVEVATTGGMTSMVRFGTAGAGIAWFALTVGWPAATTIIGIAATLGAAGAFTLLVKNYKVADWASDYVVLARR